MRIPNGPNGHPTVSASQLRTYGAGGFTLDDQEAQKGCPRLYNAKYVERVVPDESSYELDYGRFFHDVLFRMEEDGLTPDEALLEAFPANGTPEMMAEARADLTAYLERGASPVDRFTTIAVESELDALLYVDDVYGPVYYRGFIDWLGLDSAFMSTIHVVDYKTNRQPPSFDQVAGDVQLKGYDWLVMQNAERMGITSTPDVIVHLDAVKWNEIEVRFTREEIESWQDWAIALVRKILRDDEAKPVVNPGCGYCPIKDTCPAFADLPAVAHRLADSVVGLTEDDSKVQWRDAANSVRLLLEKAVKQIDGDLKARATRDGILVIGDHQWERVPEWKDVYDLRALHRAIGNDFYGVINPVKSRIESVTKDWDTHAIAAVNAAIERQPSGTTVKRTKVKREEA